jgi:hypothetical protein
VRLAQERDLAERMFDELRAAVDTRTGKMWKPLCDAAHLVRALTIAHDAADPAMQALGFGAGEARMRLDRARGLWHALREDAVLDPLPRADAVTAPADLV